VANAGVRFKIESYLDGLVGALRGLDRDAIEAFVEALRRARREGRQVFLFGNGGSAANASHLAVDLAKGLSYGREKRFKVFCLNDNVPTMLAYANDLGFADIFVEQLKNHLRPGDVVIAISGSGSSENVIRAVDYANQSGAVTVGLCGFSGGELKRKATIAVHTGIDDMQKSEDLSLIVGHIVYQVLDGEDA